MNNGQVGGFADIREEQRTAHRAGEEVVRAQVQERADLGHHRHRVRADQGSGDDKRSTRICSQTLRAGQDHIQSM